MCKFCPIEAENEENLGNHVQLNHTYKCDICGYIGQGEEVMEDHILDNHAKPDRNNIYKCDECTFKSNIKDNLGRHYKETHGSKSKEARQNKPNNEDRENCQLESELRKLKNCQWRGTRKTALPDQPGGQYLLWAGSSRR